MMPSRHITGASSAHVPGSGNFSGTLYSRGNARSTKFRVCVQDYTCQMRLRKDLDLIFSPTIEKIGTCHETKF